MKLGKEIGRKNGEIEEALGTKMHYGWAIGGEEKNTIFVVKVQKVYA